MATSAGADERPDAGWSNFWWPDLFGSDSSSHDTAGDDSWEDPFTDRGVHERPSLDDGDAEPDQDEAPVRRHGAAPADPDSNSAAQEPDSAALRPAQPGFAAQQRPRVSAQRQAPAAQQQAATAQHRAPAAQHQAPAAQRHAPAAQRRAHTAQRPAADVMAGARRAVTSRDVSASPAAPVQQRVLTLINHNRRRSGCGTLTLDRRLIEAANDHAADMARRRYFAHESPNGDSAGDRVADTGYRWKRYGENIARGADSAWEVVNGWMRSPSHRRNILDCRLHQMGIGLAIARDDTPYWVQDFATPDA
ncbi:CAP domain-containing protein [Paractinoplanes abujensis]|uniref:Uncharacterized protein YkwD n=1 Tax=Paractinoplanes abujensis TaxID=882441 RepID=A0A7W7CL95_9ACTN|nr:CAP domain-containing protein [Actinoplanes abujensis]MBB4690629.1 uncharacterized protein YkwD [Actinoplanes abujensis]